MSASEGTIYYMTVGAPSSGGQTVNEEHVLALRGLGHDARLLQWPRQDRPRAWPTWDTACPVVRLTSPEVLRPQDTVVIPEPWRQQISAMATLPVRKVIHNQNPYYGFRGAETPADLARQGVQHIMACSEYTAAFLRRVGWLGPLHVVPPALDTAFCLPDDAPASAAGSARLLRIAFMPRKRTVEAMFMPALFRSLYPRWAQVPWLPLQDLTRSQCAQAMQRSAVFASFAHLEGLGLPPLEAAASGCVVAGFTGGGGQDYATPANGFWVNEGDHEGFAHALDAALRCAQSPPWRAQVLGNFQGALQGHTPSVFRAALGRAWAAILAQPPSKGVILADG